MRRDADRGRASAFELAEEGPLGDAAQQRLDVTERFQQLARGVVVIAALDAQRSLADGVQTNVRVEVLGDAGLQIQTEKDGSLELI